MSLTTQCLWFYRNDSLGREGADVAGESVQLVHKGLAPHLAARVSVPSHFALHNHSFFPWTFLLRWTEMAYTYFHSKVDGHKEAK